MCLEKKVAWSDLRRVFLSAGNGELASHRQIAFLASACWQEVKIVAVAVCAMNLPRIASANPNVQAIGAARSAGITKGRPILSAHFHLNAQAQFVPGQADVAKGFLLIEFRQVR
ncbi:hypothetical protein HRbin36_02686 [bacterium HR36]|nr:hypothetical protein HRbin36_02686 [bacterium HR36]